MREETVEEELNMTNQEQNTDDLIEEMDEYSDTALDIAEAALHADAPSETDSGSNATLRAFINDTRAVAWSSSPTCPER